MTIRFIYTCDPYPRVREDKYSIIATLCWQKVPEQTESPTSFLAIILRTLLRRSSLVVQSLLCLIAII